MFGIGLPEMIVILALALIVVGPDKLPELARSLAKGLNELRNTMNQLKESLSEETKVINSVQEDLRKTAGQMKDSLLDEIGGTPSKTSFDDNDVDEAAAQPWEGDAKTDVPHAKEEEQAQKTAAAEQPAPEESTVGRNPAPPAAA